MTTIADALAWGRAQLAHPDARGEVEILLAHALDADRSVLYARPECSVAPDAGKRFRELVARRESGWPVAYLLGHREFRDISLIVTPDVLIPRHDTELLVELALERLAATRSPRVADLGTGSGAIALVIANARPDARVVAVDASDRALAVAAMNVRALALANVELRLGSWFEPLAGERYDLVASNPPYLRDDDAHLREGDLRYEPRDALASGRDGLDAMRRIVAGAISYLDAGGTLAVEHGAEQGGAVRALFEAAGFGEVATARDLEGRERVTSGVRVGV